MLTRRLGPVVVAAAISVASASAASATADGCAIVKPTPDGFLSLRDGPGRRFPERTKLFPGDRIWIDSATCETTAGVTICDDSGRWWHVTSVPRIDQGSRGFTPGWASSIYLRAYPCP